MFFTFICNSCEEVFEIRASISEISNGLKVSCPKCTSEDVRRDYSRINFGTSAGNGSKKVTAVAPVQVIEAAAGAKIQKIVDKV